MSRAVQLLQLLLLHPLLHLLSSLPRRAARRHEFTKAFRRAAVDFHGLRFMDMAEMCFCSLDRKSTRLNSSHWE